MRTRRERAEMLRQEIAALHEGRHLYINASTVSEYQAQIRKTASGDCGAITRLLERMSQALRDRNNAYHADLRAHCRPELGCFAEWSGT